MKKFFGILIAAFLLCLAGCNQNVGIDSSDLHGCSYVEVNTSKFISELENRSLDLLFQHFPIKVILWWQLIMGNMV